MSDFYGALSSSAFRVKDREAFLSDPDIKKLESHAQSEGGFFDRDDPDKGYFSFGWEGQYPSLVVQIWGEETDEPVETDFAVAIQKHILPGDVCQVSISGNEKLRYVGGDVFWISTRGIAYWQAGTFWSEQITEKSLEERLVKNLEDVRKQLFE